MITIVYHIQVGIANITLYLPQSIEERYSMDINSFILSEIEINEDMIESYYGEYLNSKKEDFINSIISSLI